MDKKYDDLIKSPLNYTGGKYKLLKQLLPIFPDDIDLFIDLFSGGSDIGVNASSNYVISIDCQKQLIRLFNTFKEIDKDYVFDTINKIINKYELSNSDLYGYEYYNCESSSGLSKYNKDKFLKLRHDYNNRYVDNNYFDIHFYAIIIYAFNNQIRFNKKGECNIPVGKRDFNENLQKKLSIFIDRIKEKDITFCLNDFYKFDYDNYCNDNTFIYADPPYLITTATYNEQDGWNEKKERSLLQLLDYINEKKIKFALSNVLEHKGRSNDILIEWSKKYNIHYLDFNYSNSNYQKKEINKKSKTVEVLITNY
ncbi:Dam family site-specific DNA-(adenine-N6)-methyltransferase [Alkaliphilus sp. MSJ-5]|uniref:Dam family site-specific DNA-(Adenine-N6)-methyltransferase n=1 Tax=Alkaliphilus flagellatus TaxID=2841507 RepID=A0ABS6G5C0_9FIRM|nr:Dam family site-specific DNA-(adenine-N6)-methyltransferase [Alkaliphilus flagellatus]MBU5676813.1 Dam family site-specific DNA-(adenine-N6)-methyltransferase [Alkaliphilus flagellatus]